ncbi:alpha/beta hydrolase [Altererythrobacter sp. H2]|uniref:alpha/beta hydrolase n=1 Tax=Altererythrobacter sp. H2 TaxID=3108391 RepID=UPI002B4C0680|nr:alpha/beta hydrolase [Altererythrobacter sp. H2]WRK95388.1 alpha/beta hydrolase [Altererythrobacter sp. H2]
MNHTPIDRRAIPAHAIESRWQASDGWPIRRIDWPVPEAPRGSILFLPGRGDCYEKYLETLEQWHRAGWAVSASDWRGQAGSGRLGNDPVTGHVSDFADWVNDLALLWSQWKETRPGPHVLAGHSMGGHLVLRALTEGRVDPAAVVLSAPMLGFFGTVLPLPVMHGAARLMKRLGDAARPAWKWSEKPGQVPASRITLLTHDPVRYADELWWRDARPELVMGPGSWGWVERAYASTRVLNRPGVLERVQTPVLLLGAENDRLVDMRAIERAAARLPQGELVRFGAGSRHEILREADPVRDRAMAAIDAFLDHAVAASG